mmetsp:Transcript_114742/g.319598  ORF Transcript_114742/g.319598 Transcript_114742/m.319598 type:complete len:206 (+) Transcript_114742:273-890(+)
MRLGRCGGGPLAAPQAPPPPCPSAPPVLSCGSAGCGAPRARAPQTRRQGQPPSPQRLCPQGPPHRPPLRLPRRAATNALRSLLSPLAMLHGPPECGAPAPRAPASEPPRAPVAGSPRTAPPSPWPQPAPATFPDRGGRTPGGPAACTPGPFVPLRARRPPRSARPDRAAPPLAPLPRGAHGTPSAAPRRRPHERWPAACVSSLSH